MNPVFLRGVSPPAERCVQRPVPKLDFCPRGRGKEGAINSIVKGLKDGRGLMMERDVHFCIMKREFHTVI